MPKFSSLPRVTGASEKPTKILLPGIEGEIAVVLTTVSAIDEASAIGFALADARAKGSHEPADGDPLYDAAYWAAIVAKGLGDADAAPSGDKRQPFFDGGPEQVRTLPTETIAYLFQLQQHWQEEASPTFKAKTAEELVRAVRRIHEKNGEVFFSRCSPSMQMRCALFMAGLLATSPDSKLPSGSPSSASTTTASKPPQPLPPSLPRSARKPAKTTRRGSASKTDSQDR